MKTTVVISDPLLKKAKARARAEGKTLRTLMEEGLRRVLAEDRPTRRFELPDASVDGNGLNSEFSDGSWDRIRELIYEGRGA